MKDKALFLCVKNVSKKCQKYVKKVSKICP
nr:MAG TPA: hypothetical protein [Caudoviricetes sp.]